MSSNLRRFLDFIEVVAIVMICTGLFLASAEIDRANAATVHAKRTGGFTSTQVAGMSTAEKDVRFCAATHDGLTGYSGPVPGWDSEIVGDTSYYYRAWLEMLVWPEYYPPGYPATYCATYSEALAGASRAGVSVSEEDTAEDIVDRVLTTVGQ